MQLDQRALEAVKREIQRFHRNSCYPEALEVELEVAAKRILQAVQPVPVGTDALTLARDYIIGLGQSPDAEGWPRDQYAVMAAIEAALTATASAEPVAIPDGWKLVPVKPTNEMVSAVRDIAGAQAAAYGLAAWDTMLKAAPVSGADNAK